MLRFIVGILGLAASVWFALQIALASAGGFAFTDPAANQEPSRASWPIEVIALLIVAMVFGAVAVTLPSDRSRGR